MENPIPGYRQSRRNFVSMLAAFPLTLKNSFQMSSLLPFSNTLPAKDLFEIKGTYLNAAYTHPLSKGSYNEIQHFLNDRMQNRKNDLGYDGFERSTVGAAFAKLINASPEEIAWVPSTMVGENLVLNGLSIPDLKLPVVTDAFHFHGSLHLYNQLAKQGVPVTFVNPHQYQIDLNDLEKAIKPGTKLVAVSLVSATTGFKHDLKKVCELAHAKGALVYADIIQAAGAIPIDVKDSGVDFCACATYKWLMGDFGIGFLYVKKELLPLLKRTMVGYRQMIHEVSHFLPFESPGNKPFDSESLENTGGHFEVGTFANEGIAALRFSLEYLNKTGMDTIRNYRMPLIQKLQQALPPDRFIPLTRNSEESPIVCFAFKNAASLLGPKLKAADISISVYEHMIRVSPSIYNDASDIDKLIEVLKSA